MVSFAWAAAFFRRAILLVAPVFLIACGDGVGSPFTRGIVVFAAPRGDTVLARPVQALVIQVHSKHGAIQRGVVVQLLPLPLVNAFGQSVPSMGVGRLESMGFFGAMVDTTDAQGRVKARVAYGTVAGPARLEIIVPEIGLADTLEFTVTPGAAADVRIHPRDTVLRVGESVVLQGSVVDRFGNPRDGDIRYALVSGPGTLSGRTITANGLGRIIVRATSGTADDITGVSVVPPGTLAIATGAGIYVTPTDGRNRQTVTTRPADVLAWAPSGNEIVFDEGHTGSRVHIVTMTGALRTPTSTVASGGLELYPEFSPDGNWVYYTAHGNSPSLWRTRADGTLTERVPIDAPEADIWASLAPSADRLVYVRMTGGGQDYLRLLDLTNGDVNRIDVPGHSPRWSPVSDTIAFLYTRDTHSLHGPLMIMSPDGSNQREVSAGGAQYRHGFSWSPDGKYLAATNVHSGLVHIIDVATKVAIPLGFTSGARAVAWKP